MWLWYYHFLLLYFLFDALLRLTVTSHLFKRYCNSYLNLKITVLTIEKISRDTVFLFKYAVYVHYFNLLITKYITCCWWWRLRKKSPCKQCQIWNVVCADGPKVCQGHWVDSGAQIGFHFYLVLAKHSLPFNQAIVDAPVFI